VLRLLPLALALALLAPGRAEAKLTCDSGKTYYKHARTRIFAVYQQTEVYVCSAHLRRPRRFDYINDGTADGLYGWKLYGHRLAFLHTWTGGDSLGWLAGWVDLHTGQAAEASVQPDHGIPFADSGEAVAVAPDGSIAALQKVEGDTSEVIVYAQFGTHRFHAIRLLSTVDTGDVDPKSLAIANGSVTWTTTAGVTGSAPINGGVGAEERRR
jgi:hypothetical protein